MSKTELDFATVCKIGEAIDEFEYEGKAALDEIFTEYDINAVRTDSDIGSTVLHIAMVDATERVVQYLLDKGADKTITNEEGLTPYDVATKYEASYADLVAL